MCKNIEPNQCLSYVTSDFICGIPFQVIMDVLVQKYESIPKETQVSYGNYLFGTNDDFTGVESSSNYVMLNGMSKYLLFYIFEVI